MYFGIIMVPIFSIIFLLCFNRYLGNLGSSLVSSFLLGLTAILTFLSFFENSYSNSFIEMSFFNWFSILGLKLVWSFYFDNLNLTILSMITFVSFLIHVYSIEYFSNDPHQTRFMIYLSCFTSSMILLVISNNLFQVFLGWELIGLFSYLLINFWYTWVEANKSSIKAMIINRIGDFFLSIFFFAVFFIFRSIDLNLVCCLSSEMKFFVLKLGNLNLNAFDLLTVLLLFGISAKSAQVPFHTWLVNAMSAPSPVSALIHAATLVTSGIFLILKFSFFIEYSYNILIISILGVFTSLFSAMTALVQNDSKRIIAYSTCSQLGYMTFACGNSLYQIGFFHLINHGCFKALLFLGIGSLIHSLDNKQDLRSLGDLIKSLPINYSMFLIGSITLLGFPFLSGFYSKDLIIEISFVNYSFYGFSIYFFSIFVAILTTVYSIRLIFYIYLKKTNLNQLLFLNRTDSGIFINFSLVTLTILSIFNGYIFSDLFTGLGTDFFNSSLFVNSEHYSILNAEFINVFIKNLPFLLSMSSIIITLLMLSKLKWKILNKNSFFFHLFVFLSNRWYFDFLQNRLSLNIFWISHNLTFKLIDKSLIENLGPTGLYETFRSHIFKMTFFQSGFLYHYLITIFITWFLFLILATINFNLKKVFILTFNLIFFN